MREADIAIPLSNSSDVICCEDTNCNSQLSLSLSDWVDNAAAAAKNAADTSKNAANKAAEAAHKSGEVRVVSEPALVRVLFMSFFILLMNGLVVSGLSVDSVMD